MIKTQLSERRTCDVAVLSYVTYILQHPGTIDLSGSAELARS